MKPKRLKQQLSCIIVRPPQQTYIHMLENNIIRGCPVTALDAKRAVETYGKDVGGLKGRSKRLRPKHINNVNIIPLPDFILKWHISVTLCIDIFYVNQMAFFHMISQKLQYRTVEYIESESHQTILHSLQKVIKIYEAGGFNVEYICGDQQFECVREDIRPII